MAVEIGFFQYSFFRLLSFLFLCVPTFIFIHDRFDRFADRLSAVYDQQDTFDFIVVGGGSSGLVVATRLSENFNVLLLEAGGEPYSGTYIPTNIFAMLNYPEIDWQFTTEPQENSCLSMKGKKCMWHRGLGLGGSSNLNFLMYARGHPEDYNQWANITGDRRWAYDSVLQYFKKSENYQPTSEWTADTSKYHGKDGPLTVRHADHVGMADYVIKAANEMGYPNIDYNADFPEGVSPVAFTQQMNGYRMGTFQAFLEPIRSARKSLTIHKYSLVTKILFKKGTTNPLSVEGVEYTRHGEIKTAYANKEVVLSAGAIGSPKILMASGIGPKEHLQSLNIEVKKDLPVGKNLQDHLNTIVGPFIVNETITFNVERDLTPSQWIDFQLRGKGVMSATGHHVATFISSTNAKKEGKGHWPDLQIVVAGASVSGGFSQLTEYALNINDGVLQGFYDKAEGLESFFLIPILNRPVSRGELLLKSTDPQDPPLIYPNYFQQKRDIVDLVEGIKFSVNMVENTKVFQSLDGHLMKFPFPDCKEHKFKSDEYWECYARHLTFTTWHHSGTCSMGKVGSKNTVVNSELQVIGVENLRVMDASVMPTVVSANTNAACIMIGEYGADLIKQKYLTNDNQPGKQKERQEL